MSKMKDKCSCNRRLTPIIWVEDANKPMPVYHYVCPTCFKESAQCDCTRIDMRFNSRIRVVDTNDVKLTLLDKRILKETCDYS